MGFTRQFPYTYTLADNGAWRDHHTQNGIQTSNHGNYGQDHPSHKGNCYINGVDVTHGGSPNNTYASGGSGPNGNIEFESPATLSSVFSQVSNLNVLFEGVASWTALHSQLTEARYIVIADPYHIADTIQETRIYKLLAENKVIQLKMENRLNTINQETRVNLMNQETRVYKIKRPGFIDKTTIPRVRGN